MTDLWDWAVAVYARDGVAEACLALQDEHGQCVPLLLWAAWAAHGGHEILEAEAGHAARIARVWSEDVITPLRQVRRRLKTALEDGDEAARLPLREKIKALELDAERALMVRLAALDDEKLLAKQEIGQALVIVASAWSLKTPNDALSRLAEALTKT